MSTTLANSRIELSKQMGDYFAGASTSAGAAGGTTIIDTSLMAKDNDWIDRGMFDLITEAAHAALNEERRISSLSITAGTLTVLAHSVQIGSGVDYEIHRLFTATEKLRALKYAARRAYPYIHERIWDESMVSGNWLKDGSFEIWTSSSALTHWDATTSTIAQTSTSPYYKHGTYSCKISTAAGTVDQAITNWDDLKRLAGESVTFTIQAWCDTASCLRISVYDGTTTTYSSYHDGGSAWTDDYPRNDGMYVTAYIQDSPTEIVFKIHHEVAAATSYVDDARVIQGNSKPRLYVANLDLVEEAPIQVFIEPRNYTRSEPWALIHNIKVDYENGYLYIPYDINNDRRLRIKGYAYLDFLASGVASTAWTSTININAPQTDILVAEAIVYLCQQRILPTNSQGEIDKWLPSLQFWQAELRQRKNRFGMELLGIPVSWR